MSLMVQYKKQNDTDRHPSAPIWANCPWEEIVQGVISGAVYWDDFMFPSTAAATHTDHLYWDITTVTDGAISYVAAGPYGELLVDAEDQTADQGINVQHSGDHWTLGAGKNLWFEARAKFTGIVNPDQFFIGLHDPSTVIIASGAKAVAAVDFIGFFQDAGTTAGNLEFQSCIESTASSALAVVPLDTSGDATTFANATYYKVGFTVRYDDPDNYGSATIVPYVNGVPHGTKITTGIPDEAMALSLVCQTENGTTTANMTLDWVRIAQLVP